LIKYSEESEESSVCALAPRARLRQIPITIIGRSALIIVSLAAQL
jgi:hypothetical protein